MEEKERISCILNESSGILSDSLNPDNIRDILDSLEIADVFTDDDVSAITQPPQKAVRVGRMLEMIQQKDMRAYEKFMKILSKQRKDLYDKVEVIGENYSTVKPTQRPHLNTTQKDDPPLTKQSQGKSIFHRSLPVLSSNQPNLYKNVVDKTTFPDADHKYSSISQVIAALQGIKLQSPHPRDAEQRLLENCRQHGLTFHGDTPADGNCFFHAMSDQLSLLGLPHQSAAQLRRSVVEFSRTNPNIQGPDGTIDLSATQPDWDAYLESMSRDGEWADAIILVAMAHMLKHDILVMTSSPQGKDNQTYQWIVGDADFKGTPIMLGHVWEWHYRSLALVADSNVHPQYLPVQTTLPASENTSLSHHLEQRHQCNTDFSQQFDSSRFQTAQPVFQHEGRLIDGTKTVITGNPTIVYGNQPHIGTQYNVQGDLSITNSSSGLDHTGIEKELDGWCSALQAVYSKRRSKIRFGSHQKSIVDTDSLFVDIKLLRKGNKDTNVKPIQLESYLDLLSINQNNEVVNHVLLRGLAGSGKSTVIDRISYKWAQSFGQSEKDNLSKFRLVIALDVRSFTAGETIEQAINKLLPTASSNEIIKAIDYLKTRCLFLIDGYDEMSSECLRHPTQILESPLLMNCWVIVTTRTHMVDNFCKRFDRGDVYAHVELSGFSKKSVEKYVRKFFQIKKLENSEHLSSSLLDKIERVPILDSLSSFPILLVMMCHLWLDRQNNPDLPESITGLYKDAIVYLNKHWQKTFSEDTNIVLIELGRVAVEFLLEGHLSFEAELLSSTCLKGACKIGVIYQEDMDTNKTVVTFIHKTFQEYCAAVYLASLADSKTGLGSTFHKYFEKLTDGDVTMYRMEFLLCFTCGLSIKAAAVIWPHVMKKNEEHPLNEPFHRHSSRWNIPLKLFNEATSQQRVFRETIFDDSIEKVISLNAEPVKTISISDSTFYPYPLDIGLLFTFLQYFSSLETLVLAIKRKNEDMVVNVSVMCKSLQEFRIVGCNKFGSIDIDGCPFSINAIVECVYHMPSLQKLTFDSINITDVLEKEKSLPMCDSLKELEFVVGSMGIRNIPLLLKAEVLLEMLRYMPSLRKLKVLWVVIKYKFDSNITFRLQSVTELTMTVQYFNYDMEVLPYFPSLEILTLKPVKPHFLTYRRNSMNPPLCKALKEVRIIPDSIFETYEIESGSLIALLDCMPSLEKLTAMNLEITGNVDTKISSQYKSLKEFSWKHHFKYFCGNTIIMLNRLFSCMPSLLKLNEVEISETGESVLSTLHGNLNEILLENSRISENTLVTFLRSKPPLELLQFCNTDIIENMEPKHLDECKTLKQLFMQNTKLSINTFVRLLGSMPSLTKVIFVNDRELQTTQSTEPETLELLIRKLSSMTSIKMLALRYKGEVKIGNTLMQILSTSSIETLQLQNILLENAELSGPYKSLTQFYFGCSEIRLIFQMRENTFPIGLLYFLPSLEILSLSNVGVKVDSQRDMSIRCKALKTFVLSYYKPTKSLFEQTVIDLMPSIENIVLNNVRIQGESTHESVAYESPKKLTLSYSTMCDTSLTTTLMKLLNSMPSLEVLELINVDMTNAFESNLVVWKSLKEFKLKYTHTINCKYTLIMLLRLFAFMPSLEILKVQHVKIESKESARNEELLMSCRPKSLKEFHFIDVHIGGNSLVSLIGLLPHLENLVLDHVDIINIPVKEEFLKDVSICQSLKTLTIIAKHHEIRGANLPALLHCMQHLETLNLTVAGLTPDLRYTNTTVLCKSLKTLTISFDFVGHCDQCWSMSFFSRYEVFVADILVALGFMPSIEKLTLVTNHLLNNCISWEIGSLFARNVSASVQCKSLKQLHIMHDIHQAHSFAAPNDLINEEALTRFLVSMPILETLTICRINITGELDPTNVPKISMKSLTEFKMQHCTINGEVLLRFLSSMPLLETLILNEVDVIGELDEDVSFLIEKLKKCSVIDAYMRRRIKDPATIL